MPRLFHRPPKYCLHRGTKQAVVSLAGQRVYLGPYGSEQSHEKYRQVLQDWHRRRHEQTPGGQQPPSEERLATVVTPAALRSKWRSGVAVSIDELVFVYRRHAREYYVKNGKKTREAELVVEVTGHLGKQHGRTKVEEFGPVELDAFRESLIDELDWSRDYLNKQVSRLVTMFKWCVKKEICSPRVYEQLKALGGLKKGRTRARESEGVVPVEDALVDETLPALPEIVAAMVRFQRLTGMRPGEVCELRPCDLDRSGVVCFYRPWSHKTEHHERDRVAAVGPKAQSVLGPFLDRTEQSYCFSPSESVERARKRAEANRRTPRSCGNRRGANRKESPRRTAGDCYQVSSYRNAIRRACNKLGLEVWTPNQLRHTAATEIRQRYGLEAAQVVCGHARADVTQVYAERDLRLATKVAEEIG
ncbi:site-specific integrase [Botrimarina sp.]|uniref:tyrosine-type recombinase/integrase n=1 Tax=Botrimarina sp. TaxID=2795802 RepID=UPI0032EC7F1A